MSTGDARPVMLQLASRETDLVAAVVGFTRLLRHWGVSLHAGASQVALDALRQIELIDREDFRSALRIALLHRPEDRALFDYLFNAYFAMGPRRLEGPANEGLSNRPVDAKRLGRDVADGDASGPAGGFQRLGSSLALAEDAPSNDVRGVRSARRGIGHGDDDGEGSGHAADLDRVATGLSKLLATRTSRRRKIDSRGKLLDLRATMRRSLRRGGIPVELCRQRRRIARTRLALFCDVSRSMDEYASLLLDFAAAMMRRMWHVDVFLFASELVRVNDLWRERDARDLRGRVPDCGGGTQIGASLDAFLDGYGDALLGPATITIVLSDGLDAGEPERLASAMERISRRSRAVIWLNPLLALDGYEPKARGMAAALPHVDVFAPVSDAASLWKLVERFRAFGGSRHARGFRVPRDHEGAAANRTA